MSDDRNSDWSPESDVFLIGEFEVDPNTHSISRDGKTIKLEPKGMALLVYLVQRPGSVVNREELEREVWQGVVVGYDALNNTVAKLRKAFGDDPKNPQVIRTVPKVGYQLIAEVGVSPNSAEAVETPFPDTPANPALERKLAAIFYTDVVDYSRLTGLDEERTYHSLRSCLDHITAQVERYRGRVVNYAGDAILAEFDTASNALSCAAMVQQELTEISKDIPDDYRMQFRIGVNLGEVIVDRGDIYGDGVNVAARLQALAEPGGICLSGSIFDAISHKLPLEYSFLGERRVKNIEKPVRAYQARLTPGVSLPPPASRETRFESGKGKNIASRRLAIAAAIAVISLLAVTVVLVQPSKQKEVTEVVPEPQQTTVSSRPSIAVLPFKNLSDNPAQQFIADGVTDDLTTDLSRVSGLDVVSRHSVAAYRGKLVELDQMALELDVRYVLEGSVRRSDQAIRINATLVDTTNFKGIWADRYEGSFEDLFDLQERVITGIVSALEIKVTDSEKTLLTKKPTTNLEAYDYFQRAERRRLVEHRDPTGHVGNDSEAIELYNKAIDLDPNFALAYAGLAMIGFNVWQSDGTHVMPIAAARKLAYESAGKVNEIDPDNPAAYSILALLQATDQQHDLAIETARAAVKLETENADSYSALSQVLGYAGEHEQALAAIEKSLELEPDAASDIHGLHGRALYFNNRLPEAISAYEKSHPQNLRFRHELIMALAETDQLDKADAVHSQVKKRMPFVNLGYYNTRYTHYKRSEDRDRMIAALRKAGIPENAYGYTANIENRLGANELETLAAFNTWRGKDERGIGFVQQLSPDGRIAFSNEYTMLVGTSWIDNNSFCVKFTSSMQGRDDCGYIYRNPDGSKEEQNEYVRLSLGSIYYFSAQ